MTTITANNSTRVVGIKAIKIAFSYKNRPLFEDLSFEIPVGEVHALVGRSGIGKTTLLNTILGLYRTSQGYIELRGKPVEGPGAIKGVVFKDDSLLGWLCVIDNIMFPRHNSPSAGLRERVQHLLAQAGLEGTESLLPKQLSAGMSKRVELLRALLADNEYFVGDEPFATLDVRTRDDLHTLWHVLREENPRTGVLCTHDPLEAAKLCNAVIVMHENQNGIVVIDSLTVPTRFHDRQYDSKIPADPFIREIMGLMG